MNPSEKTLKRLLEAWTAAADKAESMVHIDRITQAMVDYGHPIRFKLWHLYVTAAALLGTAVLLTYLAATSMTYGTAMYDIQAATGVPREYAHMGLPIVFWIAGIAFWKTASGRDRLITRLCDRLMDRSSLFQYGLKEVSCEPIEQRLGHFGDLQRGNYDRSIHDGYEGSFQGDTHRFRYQAFRLHYVDEETHRTTDVHGDDKEETYYEHYDRAGIILDFPFARGIHICNNFERSLYRSPYHPASLEFIDRFHCHGESEAVLARFLKPAVVQALVDASTDIQQLTVEISQEGKLLITGKYDHVVKTMMHLPDSAQRNPRVSPAGFQAFISQQVTMPELDRMLALAHTLMRYNDSNFNHTTASTDNYQETPLWK